MSDLLSNTTPTETDASESADPAKWRALESVQRRVFGVLIEKAKTTPDSYPLTLNAITTACNQKSNRKPQMQLEAEDVAIALDELRELGAVVEVHSDGRVNKFRHKAYEWLGVDKVELAVIAELLLRGEQTVGELRGRAARMELIEGLAALRPVLSSLKQKGLLIELSPEGRGQMVAHALYPAEQRPTAESIVPLRASPQSSATAESISTMTVSNELNDLKREIRELTQRVAALEEKLGP